MACALRDPKGEAMQRPIRESDPRLTTFELGFLRGVFAAGGYVMPTGEQFQAALDLLQLYTTAECNSVN
jgi:hypothetical protein